MSGEPHAARCAGPHAVADVYIIAQLRFTHRELYDRYQRRFLDVFGKFKGRLLVADERPQVLEGAFERDKVVVLEFPDGQAAMEFQESADYAEIAADRKAGADAVVLMVRGRNERGPAHDPEKACPALG